MFPGFDLYYADPAQSFITARQKLDGLDDELPEVWYIVPRTQYQVSSGADELSCIYLMNEAIRSELLHKPCRLRSARDATTSVAAPTLLPLSLQPPLLLLWIFFIAPLLHLSLIHI